MKLDVDMNCQWGKDVLSRWSFQSSAVISSDVSAATVVVNPRIHDLELQTEDWQEATGERCKYKRRSCPS